MCGILLGLGVSNIIKFKPEDTDKFTDW